MVRFLMLLAVPVRDLHSVIPAKAGIQGFIQA
jgi:hypothetical protein